MKNSSGKSIVMMLSNPFKPDLRVYKEAKSLVDAGYSVTIVAWDREMRYCTAEVVDGIEVRRIKISAPYGTGISKLGRMLSFWLESARLAKSERFSAVHCHDLDTLIVGVLLKILYKRRLVYDAHEKFSRMVLMSSSRITAFFVEIYERLLIHFVNSIIVASTKLGDEWAENTKKRVTVIGNWQAYQRLNTKLTARIRKKLKGRARLLIAYIGVLDKSRDIIPAINAVKTIPHVHFFICGEGSQKVEIQKAVSDGNNVAYLGLIPLSMVPYYTAAADVLYYGLNPAQPISEYQAPNSLGFALSTGRAVLGSNHGEIGLIVKMYKCGVLFKDNSIKNISEAICRLMDRRLLRIYQRNALSAGRSYCNWSRMAQRLTDVYAELLSR